MSLSQADLKTREPEQCLVLSPISWGQYESVLETFPEQAGLRITFIEGRLTLLPPSRRHDWFEKALGRLVEAVAEGAGIECEISGHATYRREGLGAGVEGDRTYYFGANAELMRGPVNVDLTNQPPPDLAIEVEATHRADDSVAAWGRIGAPEVWRFDIDRWALSFGKIRADGTYEQVSRSVHLLGLEPDDVLSQLKLAEQLGWSRWVAQLGGWARTPVLPKRGG